MKVEIPTDMLRYVYFTPQCPMFTGNFGAIPLACTDHADKTDIDSMEYLITTDGGMNWHWEQDVQK